MPALLLLLLLLVQTGICWHANHIAHAAAALAVDATRLDGGTAATGTTTARSVLTDLGTGPLRQPWVRVHRTTEDSTVDITGVAATVVPGVAVPVHIHLAAPNERFIAPGGQ